MLNLFFAFFSGAFQVYQGLSPTRWWFLRFVMFTRKWSNLTSIKWVAQPPTRQGTLIQIQKFWSLIQINDFAHIPWEDTPNFPKTPQRKKFLHKLLVKFLGYLPGVCAWDLRTEVLVFLTSRGMKHPPCWYGIYQGKHGRCSIVMLAHSIHGTRIFTYILT